MESIYGLPNEILLHIALYLAHSGDIFSIVACKLSCRMLYLVFSDSSVTSRLQNIYDTARNENGNTPLHLAIMNNSDICTIKYLLKKFGYEQLSIQNNMGNTPLHLAIYNSNDTIIKRLLHNTCAEHLSMKNYMGNTPLHCAVINNCSDTIIENILCMSSDYQLVIGNNRSNTPLHIVAMNDNCRIAMIFLTRQSIAYYNNYCNKALYKPYEVAASCDMKIFLRS